jgi:hypothetical protein
MTAPSERQNSDSFGYNPGLNDANCTAKSSQRSSFWDAHLEIYCENIGSQSIDSIQSTLMLAQFPNAP